MPHKKSKKSKKQVDKLTIREYAKALFGIAKLSFSVAPGAVIFKMFGIIIVAVLPIAVTYFAAQTITQLTEAYAGEPGAGRLAFTYVIITAALGLVTLVWESIDNYIQQVMRYNVESKVSDMMYEQFLSLDFWQYDDKNTADTYERAQKFTQFYSYIFDRISSIISKLVTVVFSLIALLVFQPVIAGFVLLAVLPGVFIQFKLSRSQIGHWNKNVDSRRARGYIEWNLLQPGAIAELRLNGLVRYLMDLRQKLRDKDERVQLEFERKYIFKRLLADGLQAVTELGALIWIVTQIVAREQPIGQFVYVQQLVSRALSGANGFVGDLSTIDEDLANLYHYQAFMNLKTRRRNGRELQTVPDVIDFKDVSFHYAKSKTMVLQDINLRILRGQHVAIVGENGAGKSTFIKLLGGLYEPSSGQVLIDDVPLRDIMLSDWHSKISVLQQDFQHYVFTDVQDNVYFGDVSEPMNSKLIGTSMDYAEATEFVNKLPQKLKTYPDNWMEDESGNHGVALSGGQWQRLALARNFYRDAPIIILDEPTSAIDAIAEARIFDRLLAKSNSKTVITVSHRLTTVEKADLIVVMENGHIVETGKHADLVAKHGEYYRIFERQLRK